MFLDSTPYNSEALEFKSLTWEESWLFYSERFTTEVSNYQFLDFKAANPDNYYFNYVTS